MRRYRKKTETLAVVAEPPEGFVDLVVREGDGKSTVLTTGRGDTNWLCGDCGIVVLAAFDLRIMPRNVFQCVGCGALNIDPTWVT